MAFPEGYEIIENPSYTVRAGDYHRTSGDWMQVSLNGALRDRTIKDIRDDIDMEISFMKQPEEKKISILASDEGSGAAYRRFLDTISSSENGFKTHLPKAISPPLPPIFDGFRLLHQSETERYIFQLGDYYLFSNNKWEAINAWVGRPTSIAISHSLNGVVRILVPINRKISKKIATPNPKTNPPPEGFAILSNSNDYILTENDKFYYSNKSDKFFRIPKWQSPSSFAGHTPRKLKKEHGYDVFVVATPIAGYVAPPIEVPDGYEVIEKLDLGYVVQSNDKYIYDGMKNWLNIGVLSGRTVSHIVEGRGYKNMKVAIFTNKPPKKRFATEKNYPFGY